MRIMAISDVESKALWEHYDTNRITDVDLILSCGDLDARYLSFLETFTNVPLLYVHGNHDDSYDELPPEGCICVDDKIYVCNGIRILGLGGCYPYKYGNYMYTERQMQHRILRLKRQILWHKGFDILLTHAPAFALGDGDDIVHQGYKCFLSLLDKYAPKYMVHGHMHLQYDRSLMRRTKYKETTIINASERYIWDYEANTPRQS